VIRFALLYLTLITGTANAAHPVIDISKASDFIEKMTRQHGFDKAELQQIFSQTRYRDDIIQAISHPAESTMPWHRYRNIFVKESRIAGGIEFWQQHQKTLQRAQETYGVPVEIIVAIIGIESRYGKNTGKYRVIDSLSTLAFYYPKRAKFFRGELEHFLLLSREENVDPTQSKGSYAGAMGQPQFIASSYRHYAVDFDGDGKRDLWNNMDDIIGSVANYFSLHKWQPGKAITTRANISGDRYKTLLDDGYKPKYRLSKLAMLGISPSHTLDQNASAALLELESSDGPEYWVVLDNFYVITRYNHSPMYAMAAHQLGQKILARMK
jgi:membrane-bound lytic murein transglycosylase B